MVRREGDFPKKLRRRLLEQAEYQCQQCGRKRGTSLSSDTAETVRLEVHHLIPRAIGINYFPNVPAWVFGREQNAEVLCQECHRYEHQNGEEPKKLGDPKEMYQERVRQLVAEVSRAERVRINV